MEWISKNISFLITLSDGNESIRCALKTTEDNLLKYGVKYPMEENNKKHLHSLLPGHVRTYGKIVGIEEIFDVYTLSNKSLEVIRG